MFNQTWTISDLLFQIKLLKDKVAGFESGEKFIRMKDDFKKALAAKDAQIKKLEAELSRAHADAVNIRKIWTQACDDVVNEKEDALRKKDAELKKMQEKLYEAQRQRDEALDKAKKKNLELYEVKTLLEEANGKITALTARVRKDHTNSSKPSSTSPNHPKVPNTREATGRKPGGQPGHEHHGRKKLEPTQTVEIPAPEEYLHDDNFKETGKYVRKQLVVLSVKAEVIEFYTMEFRNQTTGQRVHAGFPCGLKDDVTYDGSVKAAAYLLTHKCNVSIGNAHDYLKEISQGKIDLSEGMICNLSKEFSEKTKEERDEMFLSLVNSPVMHPDFTFGRKNGKQAAVIICATPDGTVLYQGREKKGDEGVKGSPLEVYDGTVVSDHEAAIIKHGSRHQECISHVQRYAKGSMENEQALTWNKMTYEWAEKSIHYWNQVNAGIIEYDKSEAEKLIAELARILQKGREEYEYEPPSKYYMEGYNLFKRMYDKTEDYVLFLRDPSVPPTNNLAERMARKFKRKAHQVMTFRSQEGVDHYCDGLSVIETLRAHGQNLFDEITERFRGDIRLEVYLPEGAKG